MATRKEIAENQRILYDDAVENKMFQAAVPTFEEFQKRLEGDGYRKLVYNNYKKHNVQGKGFGSIEEFRGTFGGSFYADENKNALSHNAQNVSNQAKRSVEKFGRYQNLKQRKQKLNSDFGRVTIGSNQSPYAAEDNVVKDDATDTYITSDNEETDNIGEAQQRQAVLDLQNKAYQEAVDTGEIPSVLDVRDKDGNYDLQENIGKNGTYLTEEGKLKQIDARLQTAYAERDRLNEMARKRMEEIDRRAGQGFNDFMLQSNVASTPGAGLVGEAEASTRKYEMDETYRNIMTALRQNNATITTLEDNKNNNLDSFWHTLRTTAANGYTFTDGMGLFNDVTSLQQAQQHLSEINTKRKNEQPLTTQEQLLESVLKNTAINNIVQSQYGGDYGAWARAGATTAHSLDFMKELMEFPMAGNFAKATASKVAQFGAKQLAKKAGENAVKAAAKATARGFLKATGIVAGSHIAGAAVSNTTGIGSTMGLMGQLHTGSVGYDEKGNYQFDDGMKLLPAFLEAERTQIRENGSEMFGEFIPGGKMFVKGLEKIGLSKLSKSLTAIGNKQWYKQYYKLLETGGYNGLLGEGLEEYEGNFYDVLTGHGAEAWDELKDPKTHIDIWLGVGTMSVMFGALPMVIQGRQTYGYFKYKHQVDAAERQAMSTFREQDTWDSVKDKIDNTSNENMTAAIVDIMRSSKTLTKEEKNAALAYARALNKQRAYNIVEINNANETADDDPDGTQKARNEAIGNAYAEGHDAEGAVTHTIQLEQNESATRLAGLLGITQEQLLNMSDDELDAKAGVSDELDNAIYDYQASTARYQGVMDNANDKVDMAARQAALQVDQTTDTSRGTVRNATIKATEGSENYGVYIISGNLATHEDGSVDVADSDKMILYYDPQTGRKEYADPSRFASVGEERPADEVKNEEVTAAKDKVIREQAGIIDGKVEVGSSFTITDADGTDGTEHTYEVLADNGDGTVMITLDGNVEYNPYSLDDLQKLKDAEDEKKMAAARQQRAEVEAQHNKEKADEQKAEQDIQDRLTQILSDLTDDNNNIVLANVEGNEDEDSFIVGEYNNKKTGVKKYKVVTLNAAGTVSKARMVDSSEVSIIETMPADEYRETLKDTTKIVDNSGDNTPSETTATTPAVNEGGSNITKDEAINGTDVDNTDNAANGNKETEALTLEDGTDVPMLEDGNPDFSKMTAAQTAEFYDTQFGEDAEGLISSWVTDAKKALDKANQMTVKGKNFVEQKASKEAKEKAIAEAQEKYDSAKAISDAYKDRMLAKQETTHEGRMNLIDKAKAKYNRLKNKDEWKNQHLALWSETIGKVLHRLYDGLPTNVFDQEPQTVEEYVSDSIVPYMLNYEGTETAKGVKQETGMERKDFAKSHVLAAEGKGMTVDQFVHKLWQDRPANLENVSDMEIRDAVISLITSDMNAYDMRHVIENNRIAQAERELEEEQNAAENAAYAEAQRQAEAERYAAEEETPQQNEEETPAGEGIPENSSEENTPAEATDDLPFSAPDETEAPFSVREDSGVQPEMEETRSERIESERVEDVSVVDGIVGKKTRKALERIAKMMGAKVQWQYTDINSNGWYDPTTNTIYLTLDSSITEGVQFIFGHEMTHEMKMKNPAVYEELKSLVKEMMGEEAFDAQADATEKKYNDHGVMYTEGRPAYEEEVVADQMGTWIQDANYCHTLALKMSHPLLAQLHDILVRIKRAMAGSEYSDNANRILRTIEQAYVTTAKREAVNTAVLEGEGGNRLSLRTKPAPKKTQPVYKLMRLGEDGKLYPLFIGSAEAVELGKWYDADSPALKDLKSLSSKDYVGKRTVTVDGEDVQEEYNYGAYIVNNETGDAMSLADFKKQHKGDKRFSRIKNNPNAAALNWATDNGYRWIKIEEKKRGQSRYGGESRSYYNYGINGTGAVGIFAMRPGWHAGSLPTMRQIGKGQGKNLRDDTFVWVEGAIPADIDYNEEAQKNADKDIPDHIPTDGFYLKATNANKEASQADKVGWYVAGAFMPKRIMSDKETREVIDEWNKEHPNDEPVEYDWKRESGKDFNADTMSLEDTPKFSLKDIKPVGVGSFGNVYDQFKHNAKGAIDFLTKLGSGEAVAALHHKEVGDIDLVWGEEGTGHSDGYGLSKLVKYHPEVLDDLQGVLDGMHVTKESKNRINLESDTHKASVRLTWNGERKSWLLTAFKKETSANDKRTDTAVTSLGGDTALSQAEDSAAKLDNSSETSKENREKFSLKDKEYLKAVEDGDMDKAQKMVNEAAEAAGYSTDSSYQGTSAFNGSAPWGNGYFLTKEERKEAWDNGEFEGESTLGDYINDDIDGGNLEELTNAASYRFADPMRKEAINNVRKAIQDKSKTITMYRSVPADVKEGSFRNGDWITPSRSYAVDNAQLHGWGNDYNIIEQEVPVDDVWFDGNDIAEWGYGREEDYINDTDFAYKNTKNNRKQLDAVTYDDNGNVIPLSQRFNPNNADTRYSLKDDKTLVGVHNITEDKLRKALKLGGFANPSVAIIDTDHSSHNSYGEISFIAPSALVDKETGGTAGTWTTDAYTQRYPSVERQMSDKGYRKFADWVDSLDFTDSEKAEIKRQAKDALESNGEPAWELMYLREKGIDIKGYNSKVDYLWQNIIEDHPSAEDILESMKSDPKLNNDVTGLAKSEIISPVWRKLSQEVRAQVSEEEGRIVSAISPKVRGKVKEIFERDYAPKLLNKDGSPKKSDVKKVVSQMVQQYEGTKTFSFQKSKVKASSYVHNNGLYTDYLRWKENKLDEFGTTNRLFRGYKNDGTRKYVPETLENVSKAMKTDAEGQTNGSEFTSFGSFIAKVADRVDTTDEMRANKSKLASNEDKQNFYQKWEDVYYELAKFLYNDLSYGEARLHDIVTKKDPKKYAKKEYGITLTADFMKKLDALKKAVRDELKSNYFETKFERPVRLNEFAAAVVPDNLGADVRKGLEKSGLPLYDYDTNKEGDRQRAFNEAVNSSDNIRFSLAGERGAANLDKAEEVTTRLDNLKVARQMEEAKKDAKDIKLATGWERGADGKWRYEIPDFTIKNPEEWIKKRTLKLSDVIDDDCEIFKSYPEVKDIVFKKGRSKSGAWYNDGVIEVGLGDLREAMRWHSDTGVDFEKRWIRTVMLHEVQHYIQEKEGFAQGGNSDMIIDPTFNEKMQQIDAEEKQILDEWNALPSSETSNYSKMSPRAAKIYRRYNDVQERRNTLRKNAKIGKDGYHRLAGEVESRNVETRSKMTAEERRNSLAAETEDVARKDQIFMGVDNVKYSLKEVNDKFNDRLEELIKNPNQKDKILRLGHASTFLQDGGIADADIELEFDKLKRKAKQGYAHEHPFDLTDVKDLPLAIANPISVFDNTNGRNDGQVILTELKKGDSHFIVAIQTEDQHRKGGIILQVNKIATLFPKDAKGVVNWFIQGKATNVDKEKALHYIEALQNHPGTTISSEELETAAKVIKDYKSSKENRKKFSLRTSDKSAEEAYNSKAEDFAKVYRMYDDEDYWLPEYAETAVDNAKDAIERKLRRDCQDDAAVFFGKMNDKEYRRILKLTYAANEGLDLPFSDIHLDEYKDEREDLYEEAMRALPGEMLKDVDTIKQYIPGEVIEAMVPKNSKIIKMSHLPEEINRQLQAITGKSYDEVLQEYGIDNSPQMLTDEDFNAAQGNRQESSEQKYSLRVDRYQHDLTEWKKANNLPKDAERPTVPVREPGETAADFLKRVKQYRGDMALWKTAPQYEGHLLTDGTAQGEFNRELQRSSVLARIALQDSMLAIRKAQEAIMHEAKVDKLNMAEDAYTAENRSHGKGKNEFEEYNDEFLQPLRKAYNKMMKKLGKSYDNVKVYMMAKHGLERNAQMAFKKALENDYEKQEDRIDAYNQYKGDIDRLLNDADYENGKIGFTAWRQRDNAIRTKYAPSYLDYRYDKMGITQDYSGLSALFDGSDFEEAAADLVKDVETNHPDEATDLWYATQDATKKILRDSYKAGMMTKDVYEYVRDMYRYYIPLRGWGDTNADQVWNYAGGGKGAFSQTLKEAHGRGSLADDPIAYIENMAESGILLNNKNWVKQHLLLLAENHPTTLLNVSKAWYVKTVDAQGNEEWIPASPQITANMNASQVEAALQAFEQKMEQMKQTGDATQKREHLEISYPQTNSEEREHEVRVMRDGEEYVIIINGDPQLAQAMNNTRAQRVREGLQNSISQRLIASLGRKMAAAYTSMSPLFIPSNYFRDFTMTLASTAIREDARYNYLLRKNMMTHWKTMSLVLSYQNGTLREKVRSGQASQTEQMFYDYMMNGGETGFVSSLDVEELKKKFHDELKDMNRSVLNPKKAGHIIMDAIETLNRAIEGSNRFMIYMTSVQYGRSIEEAVNDAKDVTLNFNRKGTGEHGWQTVRNLYLFINPAVQSMQTLGALAKHHKFKFTAVTTAWLASGVLVPMVNRLLLDMFGGDDDKDKYWSFTKWDRRNNMIMWVPYTHEFIKIPLAQEFRGFYGVGDMIASKMMGGEKAEQSWGEYAEDMLGQVVDMLPLDPTGYDGNVALSLMPNAVRPIFELAFNVDFTGKPLFKDSEYNKYDPNFTKAYAGTPDWLVRISKKVNSLGNDYPDVQQNVIDKFGEPRYNLNNPAVVDHILSSYLGGAYTMGSQMLGVATKLLNGDGKEMKMADVPLLSKFVSNPDDRPVAKRQGDAFWEMKERHDRTANTLSKLKNLAKASGDYTALDGFFESNEYKQYLKDEKEVKQYEEEEKKEKAEAAGDEYKPKKLTADAVYKSHTSHRDDFEDLQMSQIYSKVKDYKEKYDGLVGTSSVQAAAFYKQWSEYIEVAEEVAEIRKQISECKKAMLTDGQETFDARDMAEIRRLRKEALQKLLKVNTRLVEEKRQRAEANK